MEKGFDYAPLWKRLLAYILDYAIVAGVCIAMIMQFGTPDEEGVFHLTGFPGLLPVAFWMLYIVFIEYKFGATLGHQIVKLKVVHQHGLPLRFVDVLKRRIVDPLDHTFVAIILIKSTPNRQRLGDIVAKTVVVNE